MILLVSIEPFAYVISYYTCQNRNKKGNNKQLVAHARSDYYAGERAGIIKNKRNHLRGSVCFILLLLPFSAGEHATVLSRLVV